MFEVKQLPLCLPLLFAFSFEVLNIGIETCFDGVGFEDALYEECFSIRLLCLHLYLFYYFYEIFIYKTILVSPFLLFICVYYPLKVFKFDTGILRYWCAVPFLKTLRKLPQSIAILFLILFLMFACNNFPFCTFVTMIYWTSTEVQLNLVDPLDSAVSSLDFEQINFFWNSGFDSVSIVFDSLSVSRNLPELYFSHSIYVFLFLTLRESIYGSWLWFH